MSAYRIDIDIDGELPLTSLIRSRMRELGLRNVDLAKRMGYLNVDKGMRRVSSLIEGNTKAYPEHRLTLAGAIETDLTDLDSAYEDTIYTFWARDDRQYRREFVPHVVWETALRVPRPITVAAMASAHLGLYFYPTSERPKDWCDEALATCPRAVSCYGRVRGFWVNYSPDCAVLFSKLGAPREVIAHAVRPGRAVAKVKSRAFA